MREILQNALNSLKGMAEDDMPMTSFEINMLRKLSAERVKVSEPQEERMM
jgi:hypothetical protein